MVLAFRAPRWLLPARMHSAIACPPPGTPA
jgi:hypothetical protein